MSLRKILSVSDIITNSSSEIFLMIFDENSLKTLIGSGVYRKYNKEFIYLNTEDKIRKFVNGELKYKPDHIVRPCMKFYDSYSTYIGMLNLFPCREEELWNTWFKDLFVKQLKGSILWFELKKNEKLKNELLKKFPPAGNSNYTSNYTWGRD